MNKYLLEGLHDSGISIKLQNKTKTALLAEDFTPCSLQSDVFPLIYLITKLNNYMYTLYICSQNQHCLETLTVESTESFSEGVYNVCPIIFNIIYLNKIKHWMYRVCYIWIF